MHEAKALSARTWGINLPADIERRSYKGELRD